MCVYVPERERRERKKRDPVSASLLLTKKVSQRETAYRVSVFTAGIDQAFGINSAPTEDTAVNLSFAM